MNLNMLGAFFSFACLGATFFLMTRLRRIKLVYIVDYQVGVSFPDGKTCKILQPGAYRTTDGGSSITIIDMRPYQFIVERMSHQDALHSKAVVGIGGELCVRDPQLVSTKIKNLMADSLPIVHNTLRLTISRSIVDPGVEGKARLAATITSDLNQALEAYGVEVRNIEVTELWAKPIDHDTSALTN